LLLLLLLLLLFVHHKKNSGNPLNARASSMLAFSGNPLHGLARFAIHSSGSILWPCPFKCLWRTIWVSCSFRTRPL
jgi:hypothetical protein